MTGGQMAPTTLIGMKATTAPKGRDPKEHGYPIHMCEVLNQLTAPLLSRERTSCNTPGNVRKTKAAIKKGVPVSDGRKRFLHGRNRHFLSDNQGLNEAKALDFLETDMLKEFLWEYSEIRRRRNNHGKKFTCCRIRRTGCHDAGELFWQQQPANQQINTLPISPSYGAEMRGGTANCYVVISDDEIGAPVMEAMEDMIVMNDPSLQNSFQN